MTVLLLCLLAAVCASIGQQEAGEVNSSGLTEEREQHHEMISDIGGIRIKRQAFRGDEDYGMWTKLALNFTLNNTLSKRGKAASRKAARLWERNTCINITEQEYVEVDAEDDNSDDFPDDPEYDEEDYVDNDNDTYYYYYYPEDLTFLITDLITVNSGNYCGSVVGRVNITQGWQTITLSRKCETIGRAAHELGHALGFIHTHQRHDRDEYITVNWTNIDGDDAVRRQFAKLSNESNDNYGLPYDYGSVMHYWSTAGSTNRKPTLIPKDELYTRTLGSQLVSFYDILMMNIHYNCTGSCNQDKHEKCKNQGFAHPRNCSKCICPSGYGGDFCDERPTDCGEELNVTSNWTQLITADSSSLTQGGEDGYKRCVYWLKAPNGSNIEVRLKKLPENVSAEGCIFAGVEIKARQDQGLTGYRFCSKDDVNTTLISNSSTVPVISYMRRRRNDTSVELEYRIAGESNGEEIEQSQN